MLDISHTCLGGSLQVSFWDWYSEGSCRPICITRKWAASCFSERKPGLSPASLLTLWFGTFLSFIVLHWNTGIFLPVDSEIQMRSKGDEEHENTLQAIVTFIVLDIVQFRLFSPKTSAFPWSGLFIARPSWPKMQPPLNKALRGDLESRLLDEAGLFFNVCCYVWP